MLSQPATKVFLRTSEPRAAEWISKAIGEVESERLRETVNYDRHPLYYYRKGHGYSLDRQTKPLVLPSEVAGLSNLTAYLKSENYVVKFRFAPNPVRKVQDALVPRRMTQDDWPQRPAQTSAKPEVGSDENKPRPRSGKQLKQQKRPSTDHDRRSKADLFDQNWSGREDLNLRPLGPEPS